MWENLKKKNPNPTKSRIWIFGRSDRTRTCGILLPKKSGVPVSAYFQAFPPLSARKQMLSGTLVSTVSVYSGRVCGINCGQAKHPECSFKPHPRCFCRLHGNSCSAKSQGLSRNKFCAAVNKENATRFLSFFKKRVAFLQLYGIIKPRLSGVL